MAFENVFQGIDFQAPVRADAQRQAQFLNILGNAISTAQQKAQFDKRIALEEAKMQQKPFDLAKEAENAAYQYGITGEMTPEGQAAIQAYQAFQRPQINASGYIVQPANIMQNLGASAPQTPQEPTTPLEQIVPNAAQGAMPQAMPQPVFPDMEQQAPQAKDYYTQSPAVQQKVAETEAVERLKKDIRGLERYNEGQLQAANFASRMNESNNIFSQLELDSPEAVKARTGLFGGIAEALSIMPLGDFGSSLGDAIVRVGGTPEQQQYLNAADNWITANLRKESGAVIGAEEKANEYRKYFPIAGDSGAVIEQKAKLREKVTKGMIGQSAGAYKDIFGEEGNISAEERKLISRGFSPEKVREYLKMRGGR